MRKSRIVTVAATVPIALALCTGGAAAFEPPGNEAADLFSCDLSAVLGHPGGDGLANAMTSARRGSSCQSSGNVISSCLHGRMRCGRALRR